MLIILPNLSGSKGMITESLSSFNNSLAINVLPLPSGPYKKIIFK